MWKTGTTALEPWFARREQSRAIGKKDEVPQHDCTVSTGSTLAELHFGSGSAEMAEDQDEQPLDSPTPAQVEAWLREHIKKPLPGRIARWLGESTEFRYSVGSPWAVPIKFITRQLLFQVYGETGLLPFPTLPRGSRGIFAIHGEDWHLIHPDAESLSALLSREGKSLDEADPRDLAELFCLFFPYAPRNVHRDATHAVIDSADDLFLKSGYSVNEAAFRGVGGAIVAPSLTSSTKGGWHFEFATIAGWMHEKYELGIEKYEISPSLEVSRLARVVLHERIFSEVPHRVY